MGSIIENEFKKLFSSLFSHRELDISGNFQNPLFNAEQVLDILNFDKTPAARKVILETIPLEYKQLVKNPQNKTGIYISRAGLFSLIFQSKNPMARRFQKFVFSKVLIDLSKQTIERPKPPKPIYILEHIQNPDHLVITHTGEYIKKFRTILTLQTSNIPLFYLQLKEFVNKINMESNSVRVVTTENHYVLNDYSRGQFFGFIKQIVGNKAFTW
ncbi:putative Bro-N domain-containing protein 19 [Diachasmimorpha longicaudata entomopoxvirus]|uniref:Putative Bro-N domain-containing protein 19 n=1 Tax=Diachasmimorpha longicaudata entomopoxvirus TaxID=109981 RepID=A0A7R5WS87_9POXV|nr:putative Bro-N domain-containing protein 19 [Diachasmimorpha longicaudata entomopoxvirus]AKS26468.1 putative Bro-N domain-containing protein 19 [Diachasmimorpha longicaudata entomopoxvirus]